MSEQPVVSVVVPTRNVARTLRACLESVRRQDADGVELVVVDNWSTDGSWEIARELADVAVQAGPERSAQRNEGVRTSSAQWVLWLDADMLLPDDCVRLALDTARRHDVAAVALPETTTGEGFLTACRTLERSCYLDDPSLHNPRLLRRDLLDSLGGFDESMSGPEDTWLRHQLRALDAGVRLAPTLVAHDEGRLRVREVLRKRMYYGRSLPAFAAARPGGVREQGLSTLRAFARHRRRLAGDPVHAGGMLALRAAEAGAYAVGAVQGRRRAAHV
jgi:arabinofuranan 3-O-arabinosyltransferase